MLKKIISNSEEESVNFASEIAKFAKPGSTFALYGPLGAGKSVFSRSFARTYGVKGTIPSPTFTIVQEYKIDEQLYGFKRLYHMDLYRIPDSNNALAFGIDEFLDDEFAIKLIEWPERIEDILPPETIQIKISHIGENHREIIASIGV